jgi:hypothetical protein
VGGREGSGGRDGARPHRTGSRRTHDSCLTLVVGTQGDLLCLELRAADATLPPQPLVLAKLRSAARLARACIRTCTRVTCLYPDTIPRKSWPCACLVPT